jgi:hypothetical protein
VRNGDCTRTWVSDRWAACLRDKTDIETFAQGLQPALQLRVIDAWAQFVNGDLLQGPSERHQL